MPKSIAHNKQHKNDGLAEQIEKTAIETIGKRIDIYAINDYVLYAAGI